jgi:two-component system cell cycle sensor histidine kinase/response regulator CckA
MLPAMSAVVELKRVADELPVAIWLGKVPGGEVEYTNRAFREVLGIEPPSGAVRGTWVEPYGVHTLAGEPYPAELMPYERCLAARADIMVDDLVIHRHDGRHVNLRVFARPIFDDDGTTITHVLEAFVDISSEVEAQRARDESNRQLARSRRLESLGQLVAGIAHDFNNLLTVTKLAIGRLTGSDERERRSAAADIEAVTDSGISLVKSLVVFARSGDRRTERVSCDAVVRSILDILGRTFEPRVRLRAELHDGGAVIMGDRAQLEQVIMNLVLNARDAIGGSGELGVRTRAHRTLAGWPAGCYVVLEVSDTGAGIDPAIRDRVFEPYFTTKTRGPVRGAGLGLATVHGIVHAHGGGVEIDDNKPQGTIMRVILPCELTAKPD